MGAINEKSLGPIDTFRLASTCSFGTNHFRRTQDNASCGGGACRFGTWGKKQSIEGTSVTHAARVAAAAVVAAGFRIGMAFAMRGARSRM